MEHIGVVGVIIFILVSMARSLMQQLEQRRKDAQLLGEQTPTEETLQRELQRRLEAERPRPETPSPLPRRAETPVPPVPMPPPPQQARSLPPARPMARQPLPPPPPRRADTKRDPRPVRTEPGQIIAQPALTPARVSPITTPPLTSTELHRHKRKVILKTRTVAQAMILAEVLAPPMALRPPQRPTW